MYFHNIPNISLLSYHRKGPYPFFFISIKNFLSLGTQYHGYTLALGTRYTVSRTRVRYNERPILPKCSVCFLGKKSALAPLRIYYNGDILRVLKALYEMRNAY